MGSALRRTGVVAAALAAGLPLGGCVTYADAAGGRPVVGLVVIVVDHGTQAGAPATALTTTGLGLAIRSGGGNPGVALGYSKDTRVTVPDGGCIDLNRPGVCAAAGQTPHQGDAP